MEKNNELAKRLEDFYKNLIAEMCQDDKLECDDLCGCNHNNCIVMQAISALRTKHEQSVCSRCGYGGKHLDAPPCTTCPAHPKGQKRNEPLTLDELQKMDGEPVWVETCVAGFNYVNQNRKEWAIIRQSEDGFFVQFYCDMLYLPNEWYGAGVEEATWLAYRQKPEEGTV